VCLLTVLGRVTSSDEMDAYRYDKESCVDLDIALLTSPAYENSNFLSTMFLISIYPTLSDDLYHSL